MNELEIGALTVAVTELLKPFIPSKLSPLVALGVAVGCSIILELNAPQNGIYGAMVRGLIIGLTATGIYKAGSNKLKTKKRNTKKRK